MVFENIVLIVADTLRAKNTPSYGGSAEITDFLSGKNHVENYYSNSPWTVPAHATLFTGELPSEHGTTTQNTYFNSRNSLVKKFNEEGFRTIGLSENGLVRPEIGFSQGFDFFGDPRNFYEDAQSWNEIWRKDSHYDSRKEKYLDFSKLVLKNRDFASVKAFLDYRATDFRSEDFNPIKSEYSALKSLEFLRDGQKDFVFLNLMPVHAPYTFNEEQRQKFLPEVSDEEIEKITNFDTLTEYLESEIEMEDLFEKRERAYKASIKYLDTVLEKMYENAPDSTMFILVGDHGELIGEYEKEGSGLVDHHFGTFKELVEVPLFLYSKGEDLDLRKGGEIFDHTSLHDFLRNISEGKARIEGKNVVRSEYFGKSGFNEQMGLETPEKYRKLFNRKSFSMIDSESKIDFASDGRFFWAAEPTTESEQIPEKGVSEEIIEKGEILYQWRLKE
jgi:arylsulfatase A-like enzyme